MKLEYILGVTAIATLVLNLLLTRFLIIDKLNSASIKNKKSDIINFVLTPAAKVDTSEDTEILATEIISDGDN